jgi:RNA polymerase sigma factor (sigma-70 family)
MSSVPDDPGGFEVFYAARRAWLVRTLRPIVGDEAEDVAQDAMLELFRHWDRISRYEAPEAWLRRIGIRAGVRRRTRNIDRPRLEQRHALLEARPVVEDPTVSLVASVLAELPKPDREALVLHHLADRPLDEVADRLGSSEAATRVRLLRARRRAIEELVGLHGTWIMDKTWQRTALARELREHGFSSAVEPVLDNLEECGPIRTHLRLQDGRFLLTNRESMHLDHGTYIFDGRRLTLHSDGIPGGVTHALTTDGNELVMRQVDNRNPSIHGAPDDAFQFALLGSSVLRWQPTRSKPLRTA